MVLEDRRATVAEVSQKLVEGIGKIKPVK